MFRHQQLIALKEMHNSLWCFVQYYHVIMDVIDIYRLTLKGRDIWSLLFMHASFQTGEE